VSLVTISHRKPHAQAQYKSKLEETQKRVAANHSGPPVLLSRADLREHYGITYSRAHLHRLMREGKFPRQVALGPEPYARKAWRRADVEAWVASLPTSTGSDEAA
jgi:predicted DNA-binding transcriptional regulator AlpA